MDSLTQIALGIAVAEVTAGKKLGNRTFLYGAVLGTLPDLDIFIGKLFNPIDGLLIHRGFSHSLLFFILLTYPLGKIICTLEKQKISINTAMWMVFLCLTTHSLLDMFTAWGTQFFWPLDYRIAFKTIFVIDPLYTLPLIISLWMVWKQKDIFKRKKYVKWGLLISSTYLLISVGIKLIALQKCNDYMSIAKIQPTAVIVKPAPFSLLYWNANVATSEGYYLTSFKFWDNIPPTFDFYEKNIDLEKPIAHLNEFKKLVAISENWYLIIQEQDTLIFNDLRFCTLKNNSNKTTFVFQYAFVKIDGTWEVKEIPKTKKQGVDMLKQWIKPEKSSKNQQQSL